MNTGSYLKRTEVTGLSEEELLILDVLFDARDTFESLLRENYAGWHNLPYSHHLETDVLRALIDRFVESGLIRPYPAGFDGRIFYGLTEAGGKLWELEIFFDRLLHVCPPVRIARRKSSGLAGI